MYTPLHASSSSGQVSVAKLLLELGVEVDAVNCYGNTALHVACHNGQDVVVQELLGYGAQIDAVNNLGLVSAYFSYLVS
jgi:serine/threonine-protein phosphatase 6 regulatory ankyrin repeat subunit B